METEPMPKPIQSFQFVSQLYPHCDHETSTSPDDAFRMNSLMILREVLARGSYPGYPTKRLTNNDGAGRPHPFGRYKLPQGPWETDGTLSRWLSRQEALAFQARGLTLDYYNRPTHPWLEDMLSIEGIGVVTGKGFFWEWGPNYTADPLVIRYDLDEPHLLLIQRSDTGGWAMPGGFVDPGEDTLTAAIREAGEEAGLDIRPFRDLAQKFYKGPISDSRVTANAWPETTAFQFDLPIEVTREWPVGQWQGGDDAVAAAWIPQSQIDNYVFGTHTVLLEHASQRATSAF